MTAKKSLLMLLLVAALTIAQWMFFPVYVIVLTPGFGAYVVRL